MAAMPSAADAAASGELHHRHPHSQPPRNDTPDRPSNPLTDCASSRNRGGRGSSGSGIGAVLSSVSPRERFAWTALAFHLLALLYLVILGGAPPFATPATKSMRGSDMVFHGGHPLDARPGSCWCGSDRYCMCTPSVSVDVILSTGDLGPSQPTHVYLVRRRDTDQLAVVGGFVEVGESAEDALAREVKEETGLDVGTIPAGGGPNIFGLYSDPRRDNRRHIATALYTAHVPDGSVLKGADDAKEVVKVALDDVGTKLTDFYDEHLTMLLDYKESLRTGRGAGGGGGIKSAQENRPVHKDEIAPDVARSVCPG